MIASELRIGNLVDHFGFTIINAGMIVEFSNYQERVKPIPLTEEWLLRFGFTQTLNKNTYSNGRLALFIDGDFVECKGAKPKFVHSFQNLYFALTLEELTLK